VVRERIDSTRVGTFSEPRHRRIAEVIAGLKTGAGVTADLAALIAPHTAVMLLYATVSAPPGGNAVADEDVAFGVSLVFPENNVRKLIVFSAGDAAVHRPADVTE
jgi:hypothetical protein